MATAKKKQQEATTPQVEARIDRLMDGDFKTKAFASATIGGAFAVHGIRIIESDKGRFIFMPQDSYKKNGERPGTLWWMPSTTPTSRSSRSSRSRKAPLPTRP